MSTTLKEKVGSSRLPWVKCETLSEKPLKAKGLGHGISGKVLVYQDLRIKPQQCKKKNKKLYYVEHRLFWKRPGYYKTDQQQLILI
jgi:hypothetical protein